MKEVLNVQDEVEKLLEEVVDGSNSDLLFTVGKINGDISVALDSSKNKDNTKHGVGGIGITGRKFDDIEQDAPDLKELLESVSGKVVFLGNGFSDYPLVVVNRYREKEISEKPVIVDIFDYRLLEENFKEIKMKLEEKGIRIPQKLIDDIYVVSAINEAVEKGDLIILKYRIGDKENEVPQELLNSDLVVSVFGPGLSVIREELGFLRKGGRLYFINVEAPMISYDPIPDGFDRENVRGEFGSWIFTKL